MSDYILDNPNVKWSTEWNNAVGGVDMVHNLKL